MVRSAARELLGLHCRNCGANLLLPPARIEQCRSTPRTQSLFFVEPGFSFDTNIDYSDAICAPADVMPAKAWTTPLKNVTTSLPAATPGASLSATAHRCSVNGVAPDRERSLRCLPFHSPFPRS